MIRDCNSALNELKDHPLQGGYSRDLDNLLVTLDISEALEEHTQMQSYIEKLIANIENQFPQLHLTSLFGYFDPRNVQLCRPGAMLELAERFQIDGGQL